ncbi:MAG: MBL fold metallo-hydrolase [Treponema sp.]|jgi:glyoxylase-like metal-dependent hydrolase (beta-lactamase superfamily II)|nr:MBL fold metallo-hydrolase [Treponema sp.]
MKKGLIYGLFFSALAAEGFAAEPLVFTRRVGDFEVHTLVENRGQGRASILLGANDAQLARYIPGGTYQSETNAFLVRGGGRIVLVDTGFGTTLFESMQTLGIEPGQVDAVLITHMHGDHIGGLQKEGKALFPRAEVYLARQERDHWTRGEGGNNRSAAAALAPYGNRVHTFLPGELGALGQELLPGITPIAAFGHTPGHTLYMVSSGGEGLLILGDLIHAQDIQFPLPEISVTYDTDPGAAAAIRKRVLEYAAAQNISVAGIHLVYPAIGTVSAEGSGYRLNPAQ